MKQMIDRYAGDILCGVKYYSLSGLPCCEINNCDKNGDGGEVIGCKLEHCADLHIRLC